MIIIWREWYNWIELPTSIINYANPVYLNQSTMLQSLGMMSLKTSSPDIFVFFPGFSHGVSQLLPRNASCRNRSRCRSRRDRTSVSGASQRPTKNALSGVERMLVKWVKLHQRITHLKRDYHLQHIHIYIYIINYINIHEFCFEADKHFKYVQPMKIMRWAAPPLSRVP